MGGTQVRAALVNADGQVSHLIEERTPDSVIEQEVAPLRLARSLLLISGPLPVGLAIAGIVKDGSLIEAGNLSVRDFNFSSILLKSLRSNSSVVNDAQAAGFAEATVGAGEGMNLIVYVSIGTGIGGSVIHRGELIRGLGSAGEFGHSVLEPSGPSCSCGKAGCWEVLSSGKSLDARTSHLIRDQKLLKSSKRPTCRSWPRPGELEVEALAGNTLAFDIIKRAATYSAQGLSNLAVCFDPNAIIVGGSVPQKNELYWTLTLEAFEALRSPWCTTSLLRGTLSHPGVVGAALLAAQHV